MGLRESISGNKIIQIQYMYKIMILDKLCLGSQ